jgi:hypothetical protein
MSIVTHGNELTFASIEKDAGLKAALAMSRVDVIDTIAASKLKGRGGAGFPTGMKWNFAAAEKRTPKYVICNADEGEPGTFKDRVILTDHPDLVFEGMTIGARAMGAEFGIVYLRGEYTYLRSSLNSVIKARREAGLLGRSIGGIEGFDFDIIVGLGAGAYVCGEETALIESLEGFRGEPRNRRSSTTSRRSPGPPASCPGASTGSPPSAPRRAPVRSCSASRATVRSRASTSSRGASPSPSCSKRSVVQTPRRCRSAAPPAAAYPPVSSAVPSPSRTSLPAAP